MNGMNEAILAVAQAQQGDAIPVDIPPMTQSAPVMGKPPVTPKTKIGTMEEPRLWPKIRGIIEADIVNKPRNLQRELGPSELGTDCLHCLAAKLAGWEQSKQPAWLPYTGTCLHEHFERLFSNPQVMYGGQVFDGPAPEELKPLYCTEYTVTVGRLNGLTGGYDIKGSIDLWDVAEGATIDWKYVNDNSTLKLAKAHGPSQTYRVQASLYGIGLRNEGVDVRLSCIYFLPRNSQTLNDAYPWEREFDEKPGMWALSRANLLANLLDVIELADGPKMRDSWIRQLPHSTGHCFDCNTWPDSTTLPEFDEQAWPEVPDQWLQLMDLLEPEYQFTK